MPSAEPIHPEPTEPTGSDDPEPSHARPSDASPSQGHLAITVHLALHVAEPDPPITGWIEPLVNQAVSHAGVEAAELSLAVVGDEEMAQLHEQYTGVAGTTDVLTFDLAEPNGSMIEGDIVLCLDEAQRQADYHGHPVRHELLLYAVHGLLHLLGEDDHDPEDFRRMHHREDQLLQALGLGKIFDPDASADPANKLNT